MNERILDEVRRWLKRAEADLRVSKELLDLDEEPWIITFHAEQSIEKLIWFICKLDLRKPMIY